MFLSAAVLFFVFNPWDLHPTTTLAIVVGLIFTVIIEEIFCRKAPQWTRERALERGEAIDPAEVTAAI